VKYASLIAAAALLSTGPAFATHVHGKPDTVAGNNNKIICKRRQDTGSLVRSAKICKTRSVWEAEGADARRQVREMQDQALVNSHAPS
jgi:hypothetical protein